MRPIYLVTIIFVLTSTNVRASIKRININHHNNIFNRDMVRKSAPPMLLDVMRQHYFTVEDALWHLIESGMEQSYVLHQIHSGHRTFLRDNFLEKNCYFSTFDPDQHILRNAIREINQTVEDTVDNYLHSNRQFFRETDALAISARNINLTYQLDKLNEISGTNDFYITIRNVSDLSLSKSVSFLLCVCVYLNQ